MRQDKNLSSPRTRGSSVVGLSGFKFPALFCKPSITRWIPAFAGMTLVASNPSAYRSATSATNSDAPEVGKKRGAAAKTVDVATNCQTAAPDCRRIFCFCQEIISIFDNHYYDLPTLGMRNGSIALHDRRGEAVEIERFVHGDRILAFQPMRDARARVERRVLERASNARPAARCASRARGARGSAAARARRALADLARRSVARRKRGSAPAARRGAARLRRTPARRLLIRARDQVQDETPLQRLVAAIGVEIARAAPGKRRSLHPTR